PPLRTLLHPPPRRQRLPRHGPGPDPRPRHHRKPERHPHRPKRRRESGQHLHPPPARHPAPAGRASARPPRPTAATHPRSPRHPPTAQVIIMTGSGDLDTPRRAIRLDVGDFLGKPCRLAELEVALPRARQRLTHHPPRPAPVESPTPPNATPPATLEDLERQ